LQCTVFSITLTTLSLTMHKEPMLLHNEALFQIYFGDARTQFDPHEFYDIKKNKTLLITEPFTAMQKTMRLEQLLFLRQIHGAQGIAVNSMEQAANIAPFSIEGDFIVTDVYKVGIGVATADCLPIVFFDKVKHAVSVVHAGWRGSVEGVAVDAVKRMEDAYGSKPEDIRVFFGPSAKVCCYAVGDQVLEALERFSFRDNVLHVLEDDIMLDVPQLNKILLEEYGIKKDAFHLSYNVCTMCNDTFCSYRRDRMSPFRQMTVVALK